MMHILLEKKTTPLLVVGGRKNRFFFWSKCFLIKIFFTNCKFFLFSNSHPAKEKIIFFSNSHPAKKFFFVFFLKLEETANIYIYIYIAQRFSTQFFITFDILFLHFGLEIFTKQKKNKKKKKKPLNKPREMSDEQDAFCFFFGCIRQEAHMRTTLHFLEYHFRQSLWKKLFGWRVAIYKKYGLKKNDAKNRFCDS